MCIRFRGVRTLSERGGYDEGWRCELHEIVRGSFDFEFVVSYFVDEVFGGASELETRSPKFFAWGRPVSAC